MRRENMKFVQEVEESTNHQVTILEQVFNAILDSNDGMVYHEIYDHLQHIQPRQVRLAIQELKSTRRIKYDRKCRCHGASIYENACIKCNNGSNCREHHHTTKACLSGCWCMK